MNQDELTLRKLVQELATAWNNGDGEAFAAPFAEDADYTVWNGIYVHGRKEIAESHDRLFNTHYKNTKNRLEVEKVRFLRKDLAVVFVRGGIVEPETERWPKVKPLLVASKHNGTWLVDVFQNTPLMDDVPERVRA